MAAPIAGHLLADHGAEVIKVESRRRMDASRRGRPVITGDAATGDRGAAPDLIPLFHNLNRGKLSLTLDLTRPEGIAIARDLVRISDVVLENFTPHVMPSLGLDYNILRPLKPDLVYASLSAAGQTGPLRDIAAYAPSVTSLAGMESLVGYPGEPPIGMLGLNFSDPTAGLHGYIAILMALWHRNRTGQGQYIDLSQIEVVATLLGEPLAAYFQTGEVAAPQGNASQRMAPHGIYPAQGTDCWISIAVVDDREWAALAEYIGQPWTADPQFATLEGRLANSEQLDQLLGEWTRQFEAYPLMEALQSLGVAAAPVLSIEEQFADPQYLARQVYTFLQHPSVGEEPVYGLPWRLGDTPGQVSRPAPNLGEHNEYVLGELLGYSTAVIRSLEASGVLS